MNIIHIKFGENLEGVTPLQSRLLNELRYRMEMCEWKRKYRLARLTDDPETWDWSALDRLDREYEMIGLP